MVFRILLTTKKSSKHTASAGRPSVHMRASNKLKQYRDKVSGTLW